MIAFTPHCAFFHVYIHTPSVCNRMLKTTSVSYIQSPPPAMAYSSSQSSSSSDDEPGYYFALAGVKGEIHLVQSMFYRYPYSAFHDLIFSSITIYPALGNDSD